MVNQLYLIIYQRYITLVPQGIFIDGIKLEAYVNRGTFARRKVS